MTTIAYKDGVMAADSGSWIGDLVANGVVKVARGADGSLYGVTGYAGPCSGFIRWVNGGEKGAMPEPQETDIKDNASTFIVLIARPDGEVQILSAYGVEDCGKLPFMAVGAGCVGAMCAMAVGASPQRAVQTVIDYANGAQPPVRIVTRETDVQVAR